jgi:hypothetical protein
LGIVAWLSHFGDAPKHEYPGGVLTKISVIASDECRAAIHREAAIHRRTQTKKAMQCIAFFYAEANELSLPS